MRRLALVAAFVATPAFSHSFYPANCCSDKDCRPLTPAKGETYRETPDGLVLWDGRKIPYSVAKPSPDKDAHLCENTQKYVLCFFYPQGGA
jgi:hypothetical protein